jgi:hypothetical protein
MEPPRRSLAFRILRAVGIVLGVPALIIYVISFFWPLYEVGNRVVSPDKGFVAIVLLGDKAAFDDFFYNIYVFPENSEPVGLKTKQRVLYSGVWRSEKYLVYSGYSYPELRWAREGLLEISASYWSKEPISISDFHPIRRFGTGDVVVSLVYNQKAASFVGPFARNFWSNHSSEPSLASGTPPARQEPRLP